MSSSSSSSPSPPPPRRNAPRKGRPQPGQLNESSTVVSPPPPPVSVPVAPPPAVSGPIVVPRRARAPRTRRVHIVADPVQPNPVPDPVLEPVADPVPDPVLEPVADPVVPAPIPDPVPPPGRFKFKQLKIDIGQGDDILAALKELGHWVYIMKASGKVVNPELKQEKDGNYNMHDGTFDIVSLSGYVDRKGNDKVSGMFKDKEGFIIWGTVRSPFVAASKLNIRLAGNPEQE